MLHERDLIALIAAGRAGAAPRRGEVGIGDDCAVLRVGGASMLVTIDLMVENVHFDLSYTSPYLLGRKAVAASLSDIAAMGGTPRGIFVSVGLPRTKKAAFAKALIEGIHEEALAANTPVLGGDTSASAAGVIVDVAAVGEAGRRGPILRSGAKAGDLLYVSGSLGGSARGFELLEAGFRPWSRRLWSKDLTANAREADERRLDLLAALSHLLPKPRLGLGTLLAGKGLVSAMIDVSDGLATDLHNLCEASGVGADVEMDALPIHESVWSQGIPGGRGPRSGPRSRGTRSVARAHGGKITGPGPAGALDGPRLSPRVLRLALTGGEDYELLFTVPSGHEARLSRLSSRLDVAVTRIGRITTERKGITLVGPGRNRRELRRAGYEHFRRR